jgi:hypothetical protein
VSARLAELELKHVISALVRVRLLVKGTGVEACITQLLESAKDALALVEKETK